MLFLFLFFAATINKNLPPLTLQVRQLKEAVPFAVVGSTTVLDVGGKKVRGRQYPWGVIEVENPSHCDFIKLRCLLGWVIIVVILFIFFRSHFLIVTYFCDSLYLFIFVCFFVSLFLCCAIPNTLHSLVPFILISYPLSLSLMPLAVSHLLPCSVSRLHVHICILFASQRIYKF